jgi:hypothetical protein
MISVIRRGVIMFLFLLLGLVPSDMSNDAPISRL